MKAYCPGTTMNDIIALYDDHYIVTCWMLIIISSWNFCLQFLTIVPKYLIISKSLIFQKYFCIFKWKCGLWWSERISSSQGLGWSKSHFKWKYELWWSSIPPWSKSNISKGRMGLDNPKVYVATVIYPSSMVLFWYWTDGVCPKVLIKC